jgi:hypothetical protein
MTNPWLRAAAVFVAACVFAACQPDPQKDPFLRGNDQVQGHYSKKDGHLELLTYDSNKNGKTDTWSFMDGSRVIGVVIDKDEDGVPDRWEYYDATGKLEKVATARLTPGVPDAWAYPDGSGKVARIEMTGACAAPTPTASPTPAGPGASGTAPVSSPRVGPPTPTPPPPPGRITRWESYENEHLARAEEDTDCEGKLDKWEVFRPDGSLASVALDTTKSGKPERRLVFGEGGKVTVETLK